MSVFKMGYQHDKCGECSVNLWHEGYIVGVANEREIAITNIADILGSDFTTAAIKYEELRRKHFNEVHSENALMKMSGSKSVQQSLTVPAAHYSNN